MEEEVLVAWLCGTCLVPSLCFLVGCCSCAFGLQDVEHCVLRVRAVVLAFVVGSVFRLFHTHSLRSPLLCFVNMAFSSAELEAAVQKVPSNQFLKLGMEARIQWLGYVTAVDEEPKKVHEIGFYAIVARALAEIMGTAQPADYAEKHMREMIVQTIKVGASPFQGEAEDEFWKGVVIQPAHVSLALRLQKRSASAAVPEAPAALGSSAPGQDMLTQVMQQYVSTQQAVLDKERKRGTLSYDLKARVAEVGLDMLPDIPSEDAMIRLEAASKTALARGRRNNGSAEGEDLQGQFRPSWSLTPKLDVVLGDGSFEEKVRGALDARKSLSLHEKVDFMGYANFQGHVLDWGVKMIVTKVITPAQLIAYQLVLARVAEEFGGVRTTYYYDLLLRLKLAKALENSSANVQEALCALDRDVLADAKSKVEVSAKLNGSAAGQAANSKGAASSKGGKGGGKPDGKTSGGKGAHYPPHSRSTDQWPLRSRSQHRSSKDGQQKNKNTKEGQWGDGYQKHKGAKDSKLGHGGHGKW